MTLFLDAKFTEVTFDDALIPALLRYLSGEGFEPLISRSKHLISEIFGLDDYEGQLEEMLPDDWSSAESILRRIRRSHDGFRGYLTGDLFFSPSGQGFLYFALVASQFPSMMRRNIQFSLEDVPLKLEIGALGDSTTQSQMDRITELVSEFLASQGLSSSWTRVQHSNERFEQLQLDEENTFVLADTLTQDELRLSKELEDTKTRDQAVVIRSSGGILANAITSKAGGSWQEAQAILVRLIETGLVSQEWVVICKKTSNQVNRVDSKEKIDKMGEMGVLCSCGNLIVKERVEELYAPTPLLRKMLDQSYWMTARLVSQFKEASIPENRILLNLHEGPEEIDAFVDIEGSLLMFELKDNQFSMGHAYAFGARIGLYKPDYAVIVATKGIAPEVREHFKKARPEAEIVYVGNLKELEPNILRIAQQIRSKRAAQVLRQFDVMATLEIPISQIMFDRLGLDKSILGDQDQLRLW